jgi:hypothetical protein
MRERLTKIVKDSLIKNIDYSCRLAENITDDLLANGVVVLPVAVGKKVYDIGEFLECDYHPQMYEFDAEYITLYRDGKDKELTFSIDGMDYKYSDFGKTVFLTREEAEETLWKMKGGEGDADL